VPLFTGVMVRVAKGDNPFNPPKTRIETTDARKFMAWVEKNEALGYIQEDEHEETLNMLRAMSKRRQAELSQPYQPSAQDVADMRANRPSGRNQKPFAKRTMERDKKVAGPWTEIPKGR
jgi:hypothetical protein